MPVAHTPLGYPVQWTTAPLGPVFGPIDGPATLTSRSISLYFRRSSVKPIPAKPGPGDAILAEKCRSHTRRSAPHPVDDRAAWPCFGPIDGPATLTRGSISLYFRRSSVKRSPVPADRQDTPPPARASTLPGNQGVMERFVGSIAAARSDPGPVGERGACYPCCYPRPFSEPPISRQSLARPERFELPTPRFVV
jgi:hypothetical protein